MRRWKERVRLQLSPGLSRLPKGFHRWNETSCTVSNPARGPVGASPSESSPARRSPAHCSLRSFSPRLAFSSSRVGAVIERKPWRNSTRVAPLRAATRTILRLPLRPGSARRHRSALAQRQLLHVVQHRLVARSAADLSRRGTAGRPWGRRAAPRRARRAPAGPRRAHRRYRRIRGLSWRSARP